MKWNKGDQFKRVKTMKKKTHKTTDGIKIQYRILFMIFQGNE